MCLSKIDDQLIKECDAQREMLIMAFNNSKVLSLDNYNEVKNNEMLKCS